MSDVRIEGLTKSYGAAPVLQGLDLHVAAGSITSVLGPSGCGKSTLLRIVAGFVRPDAGCVRVGDRVVDDASTHVPAQRRGVGYVPQEGALFPHLTVGQNILFGLPRLCRTATRLDEMLELAELPQDLARRYPHELSGGQQQRVALARALAPRPVVVLLDEPFSSLDTTLRVSAGRSVARVLRHAGATAILVTHDQGEALSLSDEVAVMRAGRFVQVAAPGTLYNRPADPAIALSVGGGTLLPGTVTGHRVRTELGELSTSQVSGDGEALVLVRPEQLDLGSSPFHAISARVRDVDYHGAQIVVVLALPSGHTVTARGPATAPPAIGDEVGIRVLGEVRTYPAAEVS
ncbi:ABC transporter ATP-binding protein [Nocardioides sp.]|uniref:ABC transporter ATP-binding protein n=1 Tax=Nocardioides sp. TaxID=35761 RepID=UPI00356688A5